MIYLGDGQRFSLLLPFVLALKRVGFEIDIKNTKNGLLYTIKKEGRTWAALGCSKDKCALWIDDNPNNPLIDVCFSSTCDDNEKIDLSYLKVPKKLKEYACVVNSCDCDRCISFVVMPKVLGIKDINEVDERSLSIILFLVVGVTFIIAELMRRIQH